MISDTTKFKLRKYVWDVGPLLAYKECKSKKREKEKFSSENKRYDRRDVQDTFIKDSWCSNEASSTQIGRVKPFKITSLNYVFW